MAVREPLGLCLQILRLRSFARAWEDSKRPRSENEDAPTGVMADWVERIAQRRWLDDGAEAMADARRIHTASAVQ